MAKELKIPIGHEKLDSFMMGTVWKLEPSVRLYDKQSSVLMWALYIAGFMWIWLPEFLKDYHTSIGKKVYIRRETILLEDWGSVYRVMRHEFVHVLQRRKYWILYDIAYLFPQVLAILSLLALLAIWLSANWLFALFFLVFLLPLPAYWRMKFEMEGYAETILVAYETHGKIPKPMIYRILKNFTGMTYYAMWPFRRDVKARLGEILDGILPWQDKDTPPSLSLLGEG